MRRSRSASHVGSPGAAISLTNRRLLTSWRTARWTTRTAIIALTVAFGGVLGYAGLGTTTGAAWGAAAAIGAFLLGLSLLAAPGAVAATVVALGTLGMFPILGGIYTGAATGFPDPVGGTLALVVAYGVCAFIATRWSRGRAWVSFLLVSAAAVIPGLLVLSAMPSLGLNAARLSMFAVALLRSGLLRWVAGTVAVAWDDLRHRTTPDEWTNTQVGAAQESSQAWQRQEAAERATATLLRDLPADYTVFHSATVPGRKGDIVSHLVVGPTGVKILTSVLATGPVVVDPAHGLLVPGVDMSVVAWHAIEAQKPFASRLRLPVGDVELVIVVHGAHAVDRVTLEARDMGSHGERLSSRLMIVGADALVSTLSETLIAWSTNKTRRVARRARAVVSSAPVPITSEAFASPSMHLAVLDPDGHPIAGDRLGAFGVWRYGDPVAVRTSSGVLTGLRIVGEPTIDADGIEVVKVCSEEDWQASQDPQMRETTMQCWAFPVGALFSPAAPGS